MSTRLTLSAPAKINLYLHIAGQRAGGYHFLDSLAAFTGLADKLTLEESDVSGLSISGPFANCLPAGEDNLALKAALALGEAVKPGHIGPVRICLEKNIPVAAGLGGGSADAAAVLALLGSLWGADLLCLAKISAELGADVPACLGARHTFIAGIGEVLGPTVDLPEMGIVLVNPGIALETAAVFSVYDDTRGSRGDEDPRPRPDFEPTPDDAAALVQILEGTDNDLTHAALGLTPVIGDVLAEFAVLGSCRLARMTGSGPTCFGLFDDVAAAATALREIQTSQPSWWGWAGGFLRLHAGT